MNKKVLMHELAERLSWEFNISQKEAYKVICETRNFFVENINAGNTIELRKFGTFHYKQCPPRMARNPKTGETCLIDARLNPRFKPTGQSVQLITSERFNNTV